MKQTDEWDALAAFGRTTKQISQSMRDFAMFILIVTTFGLNPRWKHLWRNSKRLRIRKKYQNLLYKEACNVCRQK